MAAKWFNSLDTNSKFLSKVSTKEAFFWYLKPPRRQMDENVSVLIFLSLFFPAVNNNCLVMAQKVFKWPLFFPSWVEQVEASAQHTAQKWPKFLFHWTLIIVDSTKWLTIPPTLSRAAGTYKNVGEHYGNTGCRVFKRGV